MLQLLLLFSFFMPLFAEIFSSMAKIKDVLELVQDYDVKVEFFDNYIRAQEQYLEYLSEILEVAENVDQLLSKDLSPEHPAIAFRYFNDLNVIHRLKNKVDVFLDEERNNMQFDSEELRDFVAELPTEEDLNGTALGITRLKASYKLNVSDIANGVIANRPSRPLTLPEILDMIQYTYINFEEVKGGNILKFGLDILYYLDRTWTQLTEKEVAEILTLQLKILSFGGCICTHEYKHLLSSLILLDPNASVPSNTHCISFTRSPDCQYHREEFALDRILETFYKLCRNEPVNPIAAVVPYLSKQRHLVCKYVHNNHPYIILQPVQIEYLNEDRPTVAILHDVVSRRERTDLRLHALDFLKRSTVTTIKGRVPSPNKISQTMIVENAIVNKYFPSFRQRLLGVTKLASRSFESLKVSNYGLGGGYTIHLDLLFPAVKHNFTDTTNNRLTTMVTYLTDVENGGATVFPDLGLRVRPQKGSALMFFNLFRNGTSNNFTKHASCPVLYGEKWIANQWVLRNGQEFAYKCDLSNEW
ncbi:P4HA2-like protein [Mya arenaria]|uniref:procollagen-proline 4-dioxygenase n=1 Tax=Mya arenaria TaxID=6604 RepID=A0ABY7E329_MYAAR|nr:prolyl 4-hydroxylase subunit alpha-2-like isoform X1 [Mya arenaria]WAR03207.1 P4HA2-like protein [Mya arenaria]